MNEQLVTIFGSFIKFFNSNFFQALILIFTALAAWRIGNQQNIINNQIVQTQDLVELYAVFAAKPIKIIGPDGKTVDADKPYIHIQNVGTRLVYFDKYFFNGKEYDLGSQVRPSTYSQAEPNSYIIELPTNGETHVSLTIEYHDVEERKWKTLVLCDLENENWKVNTFKKERILN